MMYNSVKNLNKYTNYTNDDSLLVQNMIQMYQAINNTIIILLSLGLVRVPLENNQFFLALLL